MKNNNIIIYQSGNKGVKVSIEGNSIWLNAHQIADIFDVKRPAIVKHIQNIYKSNELQRSPTCSKKEHLASDDKIREMNFYNLDMIISVGYRVNSKQATQFRIWANSVLKDHLVKGYTVNQKRLKENGLVEFEQAVKLIKQTIKNKELASDEAKGLLDIITEYADSWLLLQKYDEDKLEQPKSRKAKFILDYEIAINALTEIKTNLLTKKEATELFAQEKDKGLDRILGSIYQTFDGEDLYESVAEKAAHLLYFMIKDHPFTDGNKRSAAFLFILFLARNDYLLNKQGERKFNDNALVALTLLVAESNPIQKELMVKLIQNFIV